MSRAFISKTDRPIVHSFRSFGFRKCFIGSPRWIYVVFFFNVCSVEFIGPRVRTTIVVILPLAHVAKLYAI